MQVMDEKKIRNITLVIFAQRTTNKKYLADKEAQRFQFFIRSPLENLSPRTGRKLS